MEKRSKLLYWIATGFLSFGMVLGGTGQILRMKFNVEGIVHLGYPDYVLPILGTWKVLAVIVILSPNFLLAKEWAYAGLFFLLTGGAVSHFASGDGLPGTLPVLLFSVLTVASWHLRPIERRLHYTIKNSMV